MEYKKCGAIECVFYDSDSPFCDICEYDKNKDHE